LRARRNAVPVGVDTARAAAVGAVCLRNTRTPHSSAPPICRIACRIARVRAATSCTAFSTDENIVKSFSGITVA
jgi:hypothetical protein